MSEDIKGDIGTDGICIKLSTNVDCEKLSLDTNGSQLQHLFNHHISVKKSAKYATIAASHIFTPVAVEHWASSATPPPSSCLGWVAA